MKIRSSLIALVLIATSANAQVIPPGQMVAGWDSVNSKQRNVKVDSTGRMYIVGSGVGGVVYGPDANATPPTQPPVYVSGWDGTNIRALSTSNTGVLNIQGPVTVSGTIPATQSGTWNINNISGTISLPTGAATAANQTTGNSSLSTIATNTGTIATNTGTIVTNTTGIATAANQTTGNSSLATIATNTGTIATNTTPGSTGTLSTVACSTSSVTVLASNSSRKKATIFFDGVPDVYIAQSATVASTTAYTLKATDGGYYEIENYTGQINAICSAATGNMRVTSIQ